MLFSDYNTYTQFSAEENEKVKIKKAQLFL